MTLLLSPMSTHLIFNQTLVLVQYYHSQLLVAGRPTYYIICVLLYAFSGIVGSCSICERGISESAGE